MTGSASGGRRFSVGLTGGIGSGKSTVADMLAARGASVVDTDQIAHALTAPSGLAIPDIRAQFGDAFLTPEGAMDRAKMRAYVFTEPAAKARLESILHPLIRIETERAAEQASGTYVVFAVPLLVESGSWKQRVTRVLVVDCAEETQVRRVMGRSGLAETQIRAIMAAQASRKDRLAAADDVIDNDGDVMALVPQVDRLHALYTSLSAASN
ncbi:dephospho-CoA kinase [Noviherbaspirillum denitrificans]|uniref:Dephospho-CoA kinase n=1 Tax=Noviherbaspirillum denitrificans TaxID=1968433 RepID=A0A254TMG7_9BURK|nr:dephospho-CoA kinase [Noviherbaspirillum denitrificans]OWW22532.1 dephospho-CoA kinase [Noviherbaspirillum denitrificans]